MKPTPCFSVLSLISDAGLSLPPADSQRELTISIPAGMTAILDLYSCPTYSFTAGIDVEHIFSDALNNYVLYNVLIPNKPNDTRCPDSLK